MDCRVEKMGEVLPPPKFREETPRKGCTASLRHFPDTARGHTITAVAEISVIRLPRETLRPWRGDLHRQATQPPRASCRKTSASHAQSFRS